MYDERSAGIRRGGVLSCWKKAATKHAVRRGIIGCVACASLALARPAWSADIMNIEELSSDAQDALRVLANEIGKGEIGILDVITVDPSGNEYPERTVLIDGKTAIVVSFPFNLDGTVDEVVAEATITTTNNPKCKWKEVDGDWILVPSPPCQQ